MPRANSFRKHLSNLVGFLVLIVVICAIVAPAYSQSSQALIAPSCQPGIGGQFFATGGAVEVKILPPMADFTSHIILLSPGPPRVIATSRDFNKPPVNLGVFAAGTELVFGIIVEETGQIFRMGPAQRNPDNMFHANVQCLGDGNAIVGFEDKLNSDHIDYNDAIIQITTTLLPLPQHLTVRTPPFDFSQGCNDARDFGKGSASAQSNYSTGALDLKVATNQVGNAFAQSGAGVAYTPDFSGPVTIRASVRVSPPSFDLIYVLGEFSIKIKELDDITIPKFGIASLESDLFLRAESKGSKPATALNRFRSEIITPISGGKDDVFLVPFSFTRHDYFPAEVFYIELNTTVEKGHPVGICGGLVSKVVTASPGGAVAEARYIGRLLDIQIEPRILIANR